MILNSGKSMRKDLVSHVNNTDNPHGVNINHVKASNPNLLDNWYFGDPINQRNGYIIPAGTVYYNDKELTEAISVTLINPQTVTELTSTYAAFFNSTEQITQYVSTSDVMRGYIDNGYTIDRWRLFNYSKSMSLIKNTNSLSLKFGIDYQDEFATLLPIEVGNLLYGKQVTFSVLTTSNLYTATMIFPDPNENNVVLVKVDNGLRLHIIGKWSSSNTPFVGLHGNKEQITYDLIAVKLELGDKQTLAYQDDNGNWVLNDPPPNKQQELAKCQRYQLIGKLESVFLTYMKANDQYISSVLLPVPLRTLPSIVGQPKVYTCANNTLVPDATISIYGYYSNTILMNITNVTEPCYVYFPAGSGLDANL